jgi:hypothetical protein
MAVNVEVALGSGVFVSAGKGVSVGGGEVESGAMVALSGLERGVSPDGDTQAVSTMRIVKNMVQRRKLRTGAIL